MTLIRRSTLDQPGFQAGRISNPWNRRPIHWTGRRNTFLKLDLSKAYLQAPLDEEPQDVAVMYKVSSTPVIFQQVQTYIVIQMQIYAHVPIACVPLLAFSIPVDS